MSVEVQVIDWITNGKILKMSFQEHTQLIKNLEHINEAHEETSRCALEINKKFTDHFIDEDVLFAAQYEDHKIQYGDSDSYQSSVDPPSYVDTDDELFRMKGDCASIAST